MQLLPLLAWTLLPGCWAVTGPGTVEGFLGESVSVTCKYQHSQERNPKFWCKPAIFSICVTHILITSEQQPVVEWDRFSIRDNRAQQEFTVTMEGLAEGDAGTYRCGVQTGKMFDESVTVEVIVSSVSPYTPITERPRLTSSVSDLEQTTSQGETVQPGSNISRHKGPIPLQPHVIEHILTSGIVVVLLLLAIAAGVLVMLSRKNKKVMSLLHPALSGAAVEMERTRSMSHTGADALTYADIDHHARTAESQLYSNAEAFGCLAKPETEYMEVKKQSDKHLEEEKAVHASVQNSQPEQQEIYANVPSAPRPREEPGSAVQ